MYIILQHSLQEFQGAVSIVVSQADTLRSRSSHFPSQQIFVRRECVTSPRSVCVGGYFYSRLKRFSIENLFRRNEPCLQ